MYHVLKRNIKRIYYSIKYRHLRISIITTKKWYGSEYGGFFVNPDLLRSSSIVYSFGIGEDISFDRTIINRHDASVKGFDPTPKSIYWVANNTKDIHKNFTFYNYGIGITSGISNFYLPLNSHHVSGSFVPQNNVDANTPIEVSLKSLNDITTSLGHDFIDVLKMDIEGGEYDVLENILNGDLNVGQILVEFHERLVEDGKSKTIKIIKAMCANGFEIFAISDSFQEVSFIKKSYLGRSIS